MSMSEPVQWSEFNGVPLRPARRDQFLYAAAVLEGCASEASGLDREDLLTIANLLRKCSSEMGS